MTIEKSGWPIMEKAMAHVKRWEERVNGSGKAIEEKPVRPVIKMANVSFDNMLGFPWECRGLHTCGYGTTPIEAYMNYLFRLPLNLSTTGRI
jgi:hypothetical protein